MAYKPVLEFVGKEGHETEFALTKLAFEDTGIRNGIALNQALESAVRYKESSLERLQQITGVIFPEKIVYNENSYRTTTPHPLFKIIATTEAVLGGKGKNKGQHIADLSCWVAPRVENSNFLLQDLRELCPLLGISG